MAFAALFLASVVGALPQAVTTGVMGSPLQFADSDYLLLNPNAPGNPCNSYYFISTTTPTVTIAGVVYNFKNPLGSGGGCYEKMTVTTAIVPPATAPIAPAQTIPAPNAAVITPTTSGAAAVVSTPSSPSAPTGASIADMTLYNLNKWPVGFAGPDGVEKDLKAYVEKEVAGKFLETPDGLPPVKDGATIRYSTPISPTPYSLVQLNGNTLDVQTGCSFERDMTPSTPPTSAVVPASSPAKTTPASCKEQDILTQQLLAYVLDESRQFVIDDKKCSLASQPDANTACVVCGGGTSAKCPASASSGIGVAGGPGSSPGGASGVPVPKLPEGSKKTELAANGYIACPINDFHVKVNGGSFSMDKRSVSFAVKLKKPDAPKTAATQKAGSTGLSYSPVNLETVAASQPAAAPAAPTKPAEPSVFFTVKLIPMRDLNLGKSGEDKKALAPNWVPSQRKVLYDAYCLNLNNFGTLDSKQKSEGRCHELIGTSIEGKAIKDALIKAVDAEKTITLDLKKALEITIEAKEGKLPVAAPAKTTPNVKKVVAPDVQPAPDRVNVPPVAGPSGPVVGIQAPYSSTELSADSLYLVSNDANGALSFAPAAVPVSAKPAAKPIASKYTYYLFSGTNEENVKDSFYLQSGMAVQVKVYMRQWWDSTENVNSPPTPVKKYCSTYLNQDGAPIGEGTGFATVNNPAIVPHYSIEGLADVPKVVPKPPAVVPVKGTGVTGRAGSGSTNGGKSGGSQNTGGVRNNGGTVPVGASTCSQSGFVAGCQLMNSCSDYDLGKRCDLSSGKIVSGGSGVCCNTKKTAYVPPVDWSEAACIAKGGQCRSLKAGETEIGRCVYRNANTPCVKTPPAPVYAPRSLRYTCQCTGRGLNFPISNCADCDAKCGANSAGNAYHANHRDNNLIC